MAATTQELPPAPAIRPPARGSRLPQKAYFAVISPERAAEYLETSPGNRNLREVRVDTLAAEMAGREWMLNGDTVVFDWFGRLLGGHHRLMACVKADQPFPTVIAEGVDPKAKPTSGTGAPYSLTDNLTERGEKNATALAATLTRLVRFERFLCGDNTVGRFGDNTTYVSPAIALAYLKKHPELRADIGECVPAQKVASPSRVAWLYHLAKRADADRAQRFMDALATGANLDLDNPVYILRARLVAEKSDRRARLGEADFQAILIKSWNAFAQDKKVNARALAWRRDPSRPGDKAEPFPMPIL